MKKKKMPRKKDQLGWGKFIDAEMIVVYNILWFKKWRWEIENSILSEWFLYENIFKKLPISDPAEAVRKWCGKNERNS